MRNLNLRQQLKEFSKRKKVSILNSKPPVDPDAPGTPGKPGYEPPVNREDLDDKGKKLFDANQKKIKNKIKKNKIKKKK